MRPLTWCAVILSLLVVGCDNGKISELESQNKDLSGQLAAKDKYIEDVTSTMNEISNQLESAWAMEKKVIKRANNEEVQKNLTMAEVKEHILSRISDINSILAQNRKRLVDLQHRLNESTTKYTGLEAMSDNLKKTLEEREQSIADLTAHVQNLETQLSEKVQVIAARDTTIQQQNQELKHRLDQINTVFYVVGKKGDLKDKGIIENQGGFLWGLLGSVTTLGTNFDNEYFQVLDKSQQDQIEIPGTIDAIVPERDTTSYSKVTTNDGHTILKIKDPDNFWRENHLAIIVG